MTDESVGWESSVSGGPLVCVAIRVPHDRRSKGPPIASVDVCGISASAAAFLGWRRVSRHFTLAVLPGACRFGYKLDPMYTAIFVYALAQALLLANWVAGPSCLAVFTLMFLSRLHAEERMMLEGFGQQYEDYVAVYRPAPNVSQAAIWPAFRPV